MMQNNQRASMHASTHDLPRCVQTIFKQIRSVSRVHAPSPPPRQHVYKYQVPLHALISYLHSNPSAHHTGGLFLLVACDWFYVKAI